MINDSNGGRETSQVLAPIQQHPAGFQQLNVSPANAQSLRGNNPSIREKHTPPTHTQVQTADLLWYHTVGVHLFMHTVCFCSLSHTFHKTFTYPHVSFLEASTHSPHYWKPLMIPVNGHFIRSTHHTVLQLRPVIGVFLKTTLLETPCIYIYTYICCFKLKPTPMAPF